MVALRCFVRRRRRSLWLSQSAELCAHSYEFGEESLQGADLPCRGRVAQDEEFRSCGGFASVLGPPAVAGSSGEGEASLSRGERPAGRLTAAALSMSLEGGR